MMMQILEAGGIQPITDHIRQSDSDNRKGYYEHEAVNNSNKEIINACERPRAEQSRSSQPCCISFPRTKTLRSSS